MAETFTPAAQQGGERQVLTDTKATEMVARAITERRNRFIAEYELGEHGSTALTYEPALDREVYVVLNSFQEDFPAAYREARVALDSYTRFQVQTHLGERLNVNLSRFRYDLHDGILYTQNTNEEVIEMIQRGADTRRSLSSESDQRRQEAEVEEFHQIQRVLGNPDAAEGTVMLAVSPPGRDGSSYSHNFHDMFILHVDEGTGERYIEARRYSSALSPEEYLQEMRRLNPSYGADFDPETMQLDVYFLSHPLELAAGTNPDILHERFHRSHGYDTMSEQDFATVKAECQQMIGWYISELNRLTQPGQQYPGYENDLNNILDAIMNKADDVATAVRRQADGQRIAYEFGLTSNMSTLAAEIAFYGARDVREVTTGCGSSGSLGNKDRRPGNMSSFSFLDSILGADEFGSLTFDCPHCGFENRRQRGKFVTNCQNTNCQKDVRC